MRRLPHEWGRFAKRPENAVQTSAEPNSFGGGRFANAPTAAQQLSCVALCADNCSYKMHLWLRLGIIQVNLASALALHKRSEQAEIFSFLLDNFCFLPDIFSYPIRKFLLQSL